MTRPDRRGRPRSVQGTQGAVAADTGTCSRVGLEILEAGGNAVDAGVVSLIASTAAVSVVVRALRQFEVEANKVTFIVSD